MQKLLTALCFALLSCTVIFANPVNTWEQATDLSIKLFNKHHQRFTTLSLECVLFYEGKETEQTFSIDIRELHNEKCGGDPQFAPRLFSFEIDKRTGEVLTDAINFSNSEYYDGSLNPIK